MFAIQWPMETDVFIFEYIYIYDFTYLLHVSELLESSLYKSCKKNLFELLFKNQKHYLFLFFRLIKFFSIILIIILIICKKYISQWKIYRKKKDDKHLDLKIVTIRVTTSTRYIPINYGSVETGQQVSTNSYLTQRSRSFLPILARYWQSTDMDRGERGRGGEKNDLPLPVHIQSEHIWCNYWKTNIFNRPLENWFLWSPVTRRSFNLIRGGYLPWNLRLANNIEGLSLDDCRKVCRRNRPHFLSLFRLTFPRFFLSPSTTVVRRLDGTYLRRSCYQL